MSGSDESRLGVTRVRDLVAVAVVVAVIGYLLVRWNYGRMPVLPRLAGVTAAVVGIAEAIAGSVHRARLRGARPGRAELRPVPPLTAARALTAAKASALAGAGIAGLWIGILAYVAPTGSSVLAAADDTSTAIIGIICAAVMIGGALWLENCCRAPDPPEDPVGRR